MTNRTAVKALAPEAPRLRCLIIDDQPIIIQQIYTILTPEYEVFMATSGEQALMMMSTTKPDIILLDVVMPDMNGLAVCKTLKKKPETQDIPIVFITAQQSEEDETNCWDAGGIDFVTKPINPTTLLNRIKVHLKLIHQTKLLRELAFTDGLTNIANRRYFDEQLSLYFRQCQRSKKPLALIMIDIDLFKPYNDHYGHQAGDESLKKIAHLLKSKMRRPNDLAARYGGEEFVCLLPETDENGAQIIAKQLQSSIAKLAIQHEKSTVAPILTVSMGIAILIPSNINASSALITEADARLYQAKQQGRNCIVSPQKTN